LDLTIGRHLKKKTPPAEGIYVAAYTKFSTDATKFDFELIGFNSTTGRVQWTAPAANRRTGTSRFGNSIVSAVEGSTEYVYIAATGGSGGNIAITEKYAVRPAAATLVRSSSSTAAQDLLGGVSVVVINNVFAYTTGMKGTTIRYL
jgi:outer membrane protein assembly factor BamB